MEPIGDNHSWLVHIKFNSVILSNISIALSEFQVQSNQIMLALQHKRIPLISEMVLNYLSGFKLSPKKYFLPTWCWLNPKLVFN